MYVSFPCNPEPPEIDANPHPSYQNRPVELVLIQCSCPLTAFGSPFLQSVFTYHHGVQEQVVTPMLQVYTWCRSVVGRLCAGCASAALGLWHGAVTEVEFWVSPLYIRTYWRKATQDDFTI